MVAGDGRRGRGARRADARARRRRGSRTVPATADRAVVDAPRQGAGAARRTRRTQLRRLWLDQPTTFVRVLRRLRQRRALAALPRRGRAAEVPSEDWAAYQAVNERFAAAIDEELDDRRRAPVFIQDYHLALVRRALRHAAARMRAPRSSGTFRGRIPIGCGSVRGAARSWRAAGQRSARVSARARSTQLPAGR